MINVYNEFESSFIFFTSVTPKIKTKEFEFVKFFRSSKDCFTLELKKYILRFVPLSWGKVPYFF